MSDQIENKTRRTFLKSAAYASALSVGGLSSLAIAAKKPIDLETITKSPNLRNESGITVIQETQFDREKVTLINESGKLQMLDARQPISLHQVDGRLVVTVNQNDEDAMNGMVLMSPKERLSFDVKAVGIDLGNTKGVPALTNLAENQLRIKSDHSVFNRIIPVQLV